MKKILIISIGMLMALGLTGCFKTHTYQAERKDQQLSGNRGVLVGQPPADTRTATPTRTMVETDIELQTTNEMVKNLKSKKAKSSSMKTSADADEDLIYSKNEEANIKNIPLDSFETYTVKKNDTLQKISLHFYGTTKNWMKIYKANTDKLKNPDKLIPGKVIRIPKLEKSIANVSKSDEGIK